MHFGNLLRGVLLMLDEMRGIIIKDIDVYTFWSPLAESDLHMVPKVKSKSW